MLATMPLAGGCVGARAGGAGGGPPVLTLPAEAAQGLRWPVRATGEHLDTWLHAFAAITEDTAAVPLFRRGYRDSMTVVKNRGNVLTALDGNRERLARGLAASPGYVQAQFVPFTTATWMELRAGVERFLQVEGRPERAGDPRTAAVVAQLAAVFPGRADREWLRLFLAGVVDEHDRFFAAERARVGRERRAVVSAVDSLWQRRYRAAFQRYLVNTGQRTGELLLSVPLGGEGRTAAGLDRQLVVAVPFPARPEDAVEAILVFAHEVTGGLVASVVADNTTPSEKRAGLADRFVAAGQVRAGLLLVERAAPELAAPYARYYLAQAGRPVPVGDASARAALLEAFPLPPVIADGVARQLDIVLAGI
jgi:hypothetical protein